MKSTTSSPNRMPGSLGLFTLLLLTMFHVELAAMQLFFPLFSRMGLLAASLLQANLLFLLYAVPLWLIVPGSPAPGRMFPSASYCSTASRSS